MVSLQHCKLCDQWRKVEADNEQVKFFDEQGHMKVKDFGTTQWKGKERVKLASFKQSQSEKPSSNQPQSNPNP